MTEEAGEGLKVPEGEVLKFWKEPSSAPPRNPCPGCTVREDDAFEGGKYNYYITICVIGVLALYSYHML